MVGRKDSFGTVYVQPFGCMMMDMKALSDDDVDALFQALADRTRRDIVRRVAGEELSVSGLAADYDMSFAAVQKHVAVLERAGLVTKRRVGRRADRPRRGGSASHHREHARRARRPLGRTSPEDR